MKKLLSLFKRNHNPFRSLTLSSGVISKAPRKYNLK